MEAMQRDIQKKHFREHCLKRLKKASGIGFYKKDKIVSQRLYRLIVESNAQKIMLYLPMKTEIYV